MQPGDEDLAETRGCAAGTGVSAEAALYARPDAAAAVSVEDASDVGTGAGADAIPETDGKAYQQISSFATLLLLYPGGSTGCGRSGMTVPG